MELVGKLQRRWRWPWWKDFMEDLFSTEMSEVLLFPV